MTTEIDITALRRDIPVYRPSELEWARNEKGELARYLAYTDRQSYLDWVAAWKAAYRDLSERLRAEKRAFRESQRSGVPDPIAAGLFPDRRLARALLAIRAAGKRDSWAKAQAARRAA